MNYSGFKPRYRYVPRALEPLLRKVWVEVRIAVARARSLFQNGATRRSYPPPRLRYRVHGSVQTATFHAIGRRIAGDCVTLLKSAGVPTDNVEHVLDFGCGCGRILPFLCEMLPGARMQGTDIDQESIAWCREAFPGLAFTANPMQPPPDFRDGQFDFVLAISVFSHLPEDLQNAWLDELRRITRPGAILILTVHGMELAQNDLTQAAEQELMREGICFLVRSKSFLKEDGLPDNYQITYHTRDYIASHWSEYFEVLDYIPGGIAGNQDAVVLRR